MEIRNAVRVNETMIDCEINHPVHGWIPFTSSLNEPKDDLARIVYDTIVSSKLERNRTLEEEEAAAENEHKFKRSFMVASPAQIRITLLNLGLLETVQSIADSNPEASIIWEYAVEIRRDTALINALIEEGFSEEQIDDIFYYAMDLKV